MATLNKVWIVGKLTRDPELQEIKPGLTVTRLNIVTEHSYKSKTGMQTERCYMDVSVWNKEAEEVVQHLAKGSIIAIEGRLANEQWIDKTTGQERSKNVVKANTITYMQKIDRAISEDETVFVEQIVKAPVKKQPMAYAPARPSAQPQRAKPVFEEVEEEYDEYGNAIG